MCTHRRRLHAKLFSFKCLRCFFVFDSRKLNFHIHGYLLCDTHTRTHRLLKRFSNLPIKFSVDPQTPPSLPPHHCDNRSQLCDRGRRSNFITDDSGSQAAVLTEFGESRFTSRLIINDAVTGDYLAFVSRT